MAKLKKFEDLTFCDDYMFQIVMSNKDLCKPFLESLLGLTIKDLKYTDREKTIDPKYAAKGARLDLYVEDDQGNCYDIEMQVNNTGNQELFRRSRFYVGVLDTDKLAEGQQHADMKNVYVIFISPFDLFGKNRRVYTFRYTCVEDKELELQDGSTIVYLNSKGQGDNVNPVVIDLLNVVENKPPQTDYGEKLVREIKRQKENQNVRESYMALTNMIKNAEMEARAEGEAKGRAEGEAKGRAEGEARGEARGRIAAMVVGVRNMVNKMKMTADAAMDMFNVAPADRPAILAAL